MERKAKIIATLGPASSDEKKLEQLILSGVDIFRLNFSHGDHDYFRRMVALIRSLEKKHRIHIGILQDLQGPKIRTGPQSPQGPLDVEIDSVWTVTSGKTPSAPGQFSISYKELLKDAQPGQTILVDDGKLRFEIVDKNSSHLKVRALVKGALAGNKGAHFPNMHLSATSLTEKDFVDLNLGMELDIDFIALSFVRRPQDIRYLKDFLKARKKKCGIVAKIEMEEAITAIDSIIEEADAIMVARGDMAIEIGPENVPRVQKMIISKCNAAAKPVITATEMLLSMVEHPTPTRAEASDVANAIMDGSDAVMLSNETAVGTYAVEAVQMMNLIVKQAEIQLASRPTEEERPKDRNAAHEAILHAAFHIAQSLQSKAIFCVAEGTLSARLLSKQRPFVPLFAVLRTDAECRQMKLVWGVRGIPLSSFPSALDVFDRLMNEARTRNLVSSGETIVITAGLPDLSHSPLNTVKVMAAP